MAAEPLGVFRGHTAAWGVLMTLFASVSCGARDVGEPFERGVTLPATDAGKRAECLRDGGWWVGSDEGLARLAPGDVLEPLAFGGSSATTTASIA